MKTTESSSIDYNEEIKRLFSGMLLGSLFMLVFSVPLAGQCSITLTSGEDSDNQNVCINTSITNITYETIEATGALFSGLPAGVTGNWSENVITISGLPEESGEFNFTVTATGGTCENITASGTISVTADNTINLIPDSGTDNQSVCLNTLITDIIYETSGASGATVTGLPEGVTGTWDEDTLTIIGTPVESGTYNYTITLEGGCGNILTSGTITVNDILPVSISITADANPVCAGTTVNITATSVNGGDAPSYQWFVNGTPAGAGSNTYSYEPENGDTISCVMTSDLSCVSNNPATSDSVTFVVNELPTVTLNCSDNDYTFYAGASITFTAGSGTIFNFLVDGTSVQNGSDNIYSTSALADGQVVSVIVTSAEGCSSTSSGIEVNVIPLPEDWMINPSGFTYSGQITARMLVDGVAVQTGFLAAFAGEECRGIAEATYFQVNDYYFPLTCYSNIESGENLIFRYFDNNLDTIYRTDQIIAFNSGMDIGDPSSPFLLKNCSGFTLSFSSGWNWFSVNTLPDNLSLNTVLSSGFTDGDYIKNQTTFSFYSTTSGWVGSMFTIDPSDLYIIRLQNAAGIDFCGTPADVNSTPVPLVEGWNWIGYLPSFSLPIDDALGSLSLVEGDYIKNQTLFADYYDTGWFGSLDRLNPGEGYMMRLTNADELIYPDSPAKSAEEETVIQQKYSFSPHKYEFNGSVTADVIIDGIPADSEKDMLYAYVDGEMRGVTGAVYSPISGSYIFPLMIYSNKPGGENISFNYYDSETGMEYKCLETIPFKADMVISDPSGTFSLYAVSAKKSIRNDLSTDSDLIVFPNPFNEILNIEFEIPEITDVRLTISDLNGCDINVLIDQKLNPDSYSLQWICNEVPAGIYFIRLEAGHSYIIRKVVRFP